MEAIVTKVEAIASRLEAIFTGVEAIATWLEAISIRLQTVFRLCRPSFDWFQLSGLPQHQQFKPAADLFTQLVLGWFVDMGNWGRDRQNIVGGSPARVYEL